ncbi:hypothetical protein BT96DRAFT_948258 [Gymnopus androsaceus JB14]|uniref:Uncharacterized protein n=1 Tax=Gymnopus androsaceus JB14 TaxID=1447944 RepID=A0A6A4GQ56_9AGAR|nr:hypothetical protein BT96DRAFT_948258 [Gymnopus androsaceus JB14]
MLGDLLHNDWVVSWELFRIVRLSRDRSRNKWDEKSRMVQFGPWEPPGPVDLLHLPPDLLLIHTQTQLHLQRVPPCTRAHNIFNSILSSHPYPINCNNSDNKTILSGSMMNASLTKAVFAVPAEGRLKVFDVRGTTSRRWRIDGLEGSGTRIRDGDSLSRPGNREPHELCSIAAQPKHD